MVKSRHFRVCAGAARRHIYAAVINVLILVAVASPCANPKWNGGVNECAKYPMAKGGRDVRTSQAHRRGAGALAAVGFGTLRRAARA
jgi:hypothetical protein